MLAARLGTTIVGIPLLLGLIWAGGLPFSVAIAIAVAISSDEARRLLIPGSSRALSCTVVALAVCVALSALAGTEAMVAMIAISVAVLIAAPFVAERHAARRLAWSAGLAAVAYAGVPLGLLLLLRNYGTRTIELNTLAGTFSIAEGTAWVLAAVSTTWAVDTFAYVVGRAVGKHQFSPVLSPKKTWEGTLAGIIAGTLIFWSWAPPFGWHTVPSLLAGLIISIACVVGDLAESSMKRTAGVKDAGSLLPGHGGLLDRIDSLAFSVIVVFLLKALDESIQVLRWL